MATVLRPVERADVLPLVDMRLGPEQDGFVTENAVSLAQAAYTPGAYPFVIWAGDRRVGFALMLDWREAELIEPWDTRDDIFLWRLMVDPAAQGAGHGAAAIRWLVDWARERGARRFVLSHMHENPASAFYEKLGFEPTGRTRYGGEDLERAMAL